MLTGSRGNFLRHLLVILLPWLVSACTSLPDTAPVSSWEQHQQTILAHDNWELSGRLNVRNENRSDTINLLWQQNGGRFEINLNGPLGLGSVRINGNDDFVIIEKAGENPVYAESLEDISAEYLGYEFPAGELYFWVRGITAPGSENTIELNDQRLLANLSQGQWQLQYDRYRVTDGVNLPGRIRMEQQPWRLTFLISRWQID